MEPTPIEREILSQPGRRTAHGQVFFANLGVTLAAWRELLYLAQRYAELATLLTWRLQGVEAEISAGQVEQQLLPNRWKLVDLLYKDIVDNYLTYLEHAVKAALRAAGGSQPPRTVPLQRAEELLRDRFGLTLDRPEWETRPDKIRQLCARRHILTHNRGKIDERYLSTRGARAGMADLGDELLTHEANILEAATYLASSVRYIDEQLASRLPQLQSTAPDASSG